MQRKRWYGRPHVSAREHPCRRDVRVGSTSSVMQTAPDHAAPLLQPQLVPTITLHRFSSAGFPTPPIPPPPRGHSAVRHHYTQHSTDCLLVVMLPTLFSSLNSLTFTSTFFSSAHVCLAAGGIPATPFSGSCSPYSERLPREVGAGAGVGVEMEGFNFLTFLGGSSLTSEDCSESTLT